jgi:ABC-type branched-subunit amino acid transport system ATPase component
MITLETRHLGKSFDGLQAVHDLDIGFEHGKITAIIGPNGAGKTTAFNIISGFLRADKGQVLCRGRDISELPAFQIARLGVGRLFQDVRVFPQLTALENVLCAFPQHRDECPISSLLLRRRIVTAEREHRARAMELLGFVGLETNTHDLADNLSFGQQKLLAIARLLALEAEILLLDEPTAGVNPEMVSRLLVLIRQLAARGKTIAVIEHNMNVVSSIADFAYFMNEGEVFMVGSPSDVLSDPEVRSLYVGL